MKRTKIIATLGPVSADLASIKEMIQSGLNAARLNFSHGDYANHASIIANVRKASSQLKVPIAIIQDLHGPKVRVADLAKPLDVKMGQKVTIGEDFNLDYDLTPWVKPKQHILIEDGLIELNILKVSGKKIFCEVVTPGKIQAHKGLNLPKTKLRFPILTPKDLEDLKFGLAHDVDYIALSFVRNRRDIINLKKYIKKFLLKNSEAPKIIAKIETLEGVKHFDEILTEADVIMVSRGDLGVELPEADVPILQKTFIQKCLRAAKPVIVATQMLDSMIRNPKPTRAEVSDVANAVLDRTDCVMLSGETAFGKYPIRAVAEMNKIIETIEKSKLLSSGSDLIVKATTRSEAIAEAAFDIIKHTKIKTIVGATESGFTARQISHLRPQTPQIVMFTPKPKVCRQMSLIWGVENFIMPEIKTYEQLIKSMLTLTRERKNMKKGEQVVIMTGEPIGQKENLNLVEIKTL
jgi:pyruvate kinase